MIKDAIFSEDRQYRYALRRIFDQERFEKEGACTFICLNPSTADETIDDPTVRRCINYAKEWGYPAFIMLNIFAFRATHPLDMTGHYMYMKDNAFKNDFAVNNLHIANICKNDSALVIAARGNHGGFLDRAKDIELLLEYNDIDIHCLKINRNSRMPAHPLYLKKSLKPMLLKEARLRP